MRAWCAQGEGPCRGAVVDTEDSTETEVGQRSGQGSEGPESGREDRRGASEGIGPTYAGVRLWCAPGVPPGVHRGRPGVPGGAGAEMG